MKPFSAFGILHTLRSQRQQLARVFKHKYPKLEAELTALKNEVNGGVLTLLLDTLLDLDLIREELTMSQSSVSSIDTDGGRDGNHGGERDTILTARCEA
jgi:hypothetical protein